MVDMLFAYYCTDINMQKLNKGKSKLKDGSYVDLVSEKESNTVNFRYCRHL